VSFAAASRRFNYTGAGLAMALNQATKRYDLGMVIECEITHLFALMDTVDFAFTIKATVLEDEDRLPFEVRVKMVYKLIVDNFPSLRPGSHWAVVPSDGWVAPDPRPLSISQLMAATVWGEHHEVDPETHEVATVVNRARVLIRSAVGPSDFAHAL
jgi:hypothetical protein